MLVVVVVLVAAAAGSISKVLNECFYPISRSSPTMVGKNRLQVTSSNHLFINLTPAS